MDKRKVVEPFLYIDQPLFQKPSARMQEQYYSKASEEKTEPQKGSKQKNKKDIKFKYLTIQQKVDYLLNLPGEMPRLRCEIVTDEGKYRGNYYRSEYRDSFTKSVWQG